MKTVSEVVFGPSTKICKSMVVSPFGMLEELDDHCLNALIPKGLKIVIVSLYPSFLILRLQFNSSRILFINCVDTRKQDSVRWMKIYQFLLNAWVHDEDKNMPIDYL